MQGKQEDPSLVHIPGSRHFPPFCRPRDTAESFLRELCAQGLGNRASKNTLIILLGYNLRCFLRPKQGQEIQTWLPWVLSLCYRLKGRNSASSLAGDAWGSPSSFLQDINKLAAKKILPPGCPYAFPLTWSLLSCSAAPRGNVLPSAPLSFSFSSTLLKKSRLLALLWCCSQQKKRVRNTHRWYSHSFFFFFS